MKSKRTLKFHELYAALPPGVRKQTDKAYAQFRRDADYPGLNFKSVGGDPVWYSVRIGIGYRAVCTRNAGVYLWFWIGTHTEYDKLLKQR